MSTYTIPMSKEQLLILLLSRLFDSWLLRMQADCQIPNVIKAENGFILISIQKCFKNRCKAHDTVVLHRFLVSLHIRASIYMLYNAFTLFLCSPFGDPSPLYGILRIAAATAHVLEIVCHGAV